MESIELRLQRLERSNKCWRTACLAVLIVTGVALCMGADAAKDEIPEVVKARRFEVIDEKGNVAAGLGLGLGNESGVMFVRRTISAYDWKSAVIVQASSRAGEVRTYNFEGKPSVEIGYATYGGPLQLDSQTGGCVNVHDHRGKVATKFQVTENGGSVEVRNVAEKAVAQIGVTKANCGSVQACDFDGNPQQRLDGLPRR